MCQPDKHDMIDCPHEFHESEAAVATEGLCPLCLAADVNRLMIENERLRTQNKRLQEQFLECNANFIKSVEIF